MGWPRRIALGVGAAAFLWTPPNALTYATVHDAMHSGHTKVEIDAKFDQLSFSSDFVRQHPYAAVVSRPYYYVKVWPGKTLAYIRHDLE